jgi:hypothetical protein
VGLDRVLQLVVYDSNLVQNKNRLAIMAHTSTTAAKPAGNSLDHPGFWRFFVNVYLNAALLGEGDEIVRSYSEACGVPPQEIIARLRTFVHHGAEWTSN